MFAYEPPIDPPCNYWEEYGKKLFIENKIREICAKVASKGENCEFSDIFNFLFEHIEDNIETFLPEVDCGHFE